MFNFLKTKLTAIKGYIQKGIADFMREPAIATAQAMAAQVKPQPISAVREGAVEAIDAATPHVGQAARVAVNAVVDQAATRARNLFTEPTAAPTVVPTGSITPPVTTTPKANMIPTFLNAFGSFVMKMLFKFIMKLFGPLFGFGSSSQPVAAPVVAPVATAPVTPVAPVATAPVTPVAPVAPVAATSTVNNPAVISAVSQLVTALLPVAMGTFAAPAPAETAPIAPTPITEDTTSMRMG